MRRALRCDGIVPQFEGEEHQGSPELVREMLRWLGENGARSDIDVIAQGETPADDPDAAAELPPGGYYRDQWWVASGTRPTYYGAGINGQLVLIDGPTDVVIAKLSTWPEAWSEEHATATLSACLDLARQSGGRRGGAGGVAPGGRASRRGPE